MSNVFCFPFSAGVIGRISGTALLCILLSSRLGAQGSNTPLFAVAPTVSVNGLPASMTGMRSFTTGDFNGDGVADTAFLADTANSSTEVVVLLSQKGGVPRAVTGAPGCSVAIAAADVNQDHKLDLVFACRPNFLEIELGNGDGTFQSPTVIQTPGGPQDLMMDVLFSDLNGDGFPDLVFLNATGFGVVLNAQGTFGSPQVYPLAAGVNFYLMAAGDFNGDGKQDLVFSNGGTAAATYVFGNGDGTFSAGQALPANVDLIAVGDYNHDGYSDLAFSTPYDASGRVASSLIVLLGGSGGLATSGSSIITNSADPEFLTAIDLTGSGNLDLVQGNSLDLGGGSAPADTLILLNDGKGNFTGPTSYVAQSTYGVADLNGDGVPDLVGLGTAGAGLAFAAGIGDGSFQALPHTPSLPQTQAVAVADMNGDGLTDAIIYQQNSIPLVLLGRGDGQFTAVPDASLPAAGGFTVTADFNGDGKTDVASIEPGRVAAGTSPQVNGAVAIYLGNGDGTIAFAQQTTLNNAAFISAAAGDFNGDKKQDLVLVYYDINSVAGGAIFLPGNGDGTFGTPQSISLLDPSPGTVQAADLNGDGITDIVVSGSESLSATYLGNSSATFPFLQMIPSGGVVADLNGDGKLELITLLNGLLSVSTAGSDGKFSGGVGSSVSSGQGSNFSLFSVGDLNNDGLADIAVIFVSGSFTPGLGYVQGLNVLLNQGGNSFTEDPTTYYIGSVNTQYVDSAPRYAGIPVAVARLNRNSPATGSKQALDLLVYSDSGLTALLNQLNSAAKPSPTVNVSLAGGVTTITKGETVTVEAMIVAANSTLPTGMVSFFAGAAQVGSSAVINGVASVAAPITVSGPLILRASYSGDANYGPSSGFTSLVVNAPSATTTALTASATTLNEGQQVVLQATVQGDSPSGTVTFLNGTTSLGTATLSGGSATLTTSFTTAGTIAVTASYGGDPNNLVSTSNAINITVAAPGFGISATPSSATIAAGQSATFTITVTPTGGFADAVSLSCGTLPSLANCSFSSPSVTPSNGQAAQVQLTVATAAPTAKLLRIPQAPAPWVPTGVLMSFAGVAGFLGRSRKRQWLRSFRVITLAMICLGSGICFIGCGGGGSSVPRNPGTPAGVSAIVVSASAANGSSPHTANIQLTIQ